MRRLSEALVFTTALFAAGAACAQTLDKNVKIGSLGDQSSLYADIGGPGSVIAAQMAVEDSGLLQKGWKIEVIAADHQNKPDVGGNIARQWADVDKVDAYIDMAASSVGLAVAGIARDKNVVNLNTASATSDLTNAQCTPNTVHWVYDTFMLANGTGKALVKSGGDTWFFLTADYAFGHALERDTGDVVKAAGGKVVGAVRHPLNTSDFSSYLLQAQASKAKIVGLANAGGDTTNAIKQAREFGLDKRGQKVAALFMNITDVDALGLEAAQGLIITTSFYWDRTEASRAFSKRFFAQHNRMPTFLTAGAYSAVTHYLKAVQAAGTDDTAKVVEQMRKTKINDPMTENGWIREDGRVMRDFYVVQVKKPEESKYPWDYYRIIGTVPAEEAALPLSRSECKLVKKTN